MGYALAQVLAMGGSSFPKMGTDGTGFRILRELGHTLRPPYPALTPLKGCVARPGTPLLSMRTVHSPWVTTFFCMRKHGWRGGEGKDTDCCCAWHSAHPAGSQLAGLAAYEAQLESVPARSPDGNAAGPAGGGRQHRRGARRAARRSLLFTHRGFSGPGVLDLSHTFTMAAGRGAPPPGTAASRVAVSC